MIGSEMKAKLTLNHLSSGQHALITNISGGWGVRQRLLQVGLHIGDVITLKRSATMGGPILLRLDQADIALGRGMAAHIHVELVQSN
jgi:ferrous iron transport protein A